MNALLSTTYFGPIQWYQKLYRADMVLIERCESFQKQTYRNRCLIASTQGVQALTVPIKSEEVKVKSEEFAAAIPSVESTGTPEGNSSLFTLHSSLINNVRISDHGNWRHLHWNALKSAYGESPFFEYYEDDLRPFFQPDWEFLFAFNEAIRKKMCELLDIHPNVHYTESFTPPLTLHPSCVPSEACDQRSSAPFTLHPSPFTSLRDFRYAIQPKHPAPDADFTPRPYYQVYREKHGFLPNLSILDLLMNMGPESIFYL